MTTPHVIASSSGAHHATSVTSTGIVGSHYRVGKKIGEGSFGVVFEGILILLFFLLLGGRTLLEMRGARILFVCSCAGTTPVVPLSFAVPVLLSWAVSDRTWFITAC
jgi:hypothetical protein